MEDMIINNIVEMVRVAISDIVAVEGEIRSMNTYGHSVFIKFANGNVYQQPLISQFTDFPLLDEIGFN